MLLFLLFLFWNLTCKVLSPQVRSYLDQSIAMPKRILVDLLAEVTYPTEFPFSAEHFKRQDETSDSEFYSSPRLVFHIDDAARASLEVYYSDYLPRDAYAHLDLCSSWVSHLPPEYSPERVVGIGLNHDELSNNERLTEFVVHDLNKEPRMSFLKDGEFDVVTNVVSVDYLIHPLLVFSEMLRVLKPGGIAVMSFSNRRYPSKVIDIWHHTNDYEHILIVAAYFKFSGFVEVKAMDITSPNGHDPMYVVVGTKPNETSVCKGDGDECSANG